ncbi:U3 small nucleolar RNA-associated protein 18 homolog [Paramacrobiotus metropolitanus]|uniref:U3 small nucleolar RNA-associated protein 18 homolog n=1 Tax=Paramacrobiotus metropolitanus TaxID=2943436 RepID=UPI0024460F7C|nr:U3 small nucleolar RNA-associated protein 18 homolog [Paramacrobiotus metropolitanus]
MDAFQRFSESPGRDKSDTERRLEQLVFGNSTDFEQILDRNLKQSLAITEDLVPNADLSEESGERLAVWHDTDDEDNFVDVAKQRRYKRFKTAEEKRVSAGTLSQRLRNEYEKNLPTPAWAAQPKSGRDISEEDPTTSLSSATGNYIDKRFEKLKLKNFVCQRVTNLNFEQPAKGIIHAVEFHPAAQIGLVASFGRSATLFQVDGKANSQLKSVFFERFPISCCHFLDEGNQFLVSSKLHSHMYYFDLPSEKTIKIPWNKAIRDESFKSFVVSPDGSSVAFLGKEGNIHLIDGRSKEWIGTLKMNGMVNSLSFSGNSQHLLSIGDAGEVYIWNVKSRKCVTKFTDNGCVVGTAVAVSPNDRFVAVGSNTGAVNIYAENDCFSKAAPLPVKTVLNLTTSVTSLKFNSTSELLSLSSNYLHGASKLLHMEKMQMIPTFPELNHKVRKVECVDFSVNSGYFALGNNMGEALLYRLPFFDTF